MNSDSVTAFSPFAGRKLPDIGPLSVSAKLTGKEGKYAVSDMLATLEDKTLSAEAKGSIGDLAALNGLKLEAKLATGHLAEILKGIGFQLEYPLPDKVNVAVVMEGNLKELAVKQFQTSIEGQGVNVSGTAEVKNIMTMAGVTADVEVKSESLDLIAEITKTKLPQFGPLKVTANIVCKGEHLNLMEIKADLNGKIIHADVAGSIGDPLNLKDVNADVNLGVDSLTWLADYLKTELPPLSAFKASANIVSKGDTFEATNIRADLTGEKIKAKITGSVQDVLKLTGINADINFSVDSLAMLDELLNQKLPASGPVTLDGKIASQGGLEAPTQIDTVIKSDGIMANITGSIAEPLAARGIDLALNVEAESMQHVGKLAGTEFVSTDPMKLAAKLTSDKNSYQLADLYLEIGKLNVKGKAAFQQPSSATARPQINAVLHVGDLDFSKGQKARLEAAENKIEITKNEEEEVDADNEDKKKKVFPSDPLPWKPLRTIDADIEVTVETLKTLQLNLEKVIAKMRLNDGLLTLKPLQAKVGNGSFGGSATLDARNSPATLAADIKLSDATFRDFGGKVNFLVDLEGSGNSVAEIMAGLDGQFQFDVRDVTLKKSVMTGFGSGMLDSLNPFTKDEENTELSCAIILFNIEDGIADANKTIAAQMTDVTWFGSGEINLRTEEIDFGMSPKPRKGLGLSMGNLAKLAHLGGTLAQPKVEFDPKDVAVKYGKYTAAVATGGLTLALDHL